MKLVGLQHALLELETDTIEVVAELCQEFDRSYSEMAEANKLQYNSYFTQVGMDTQHICYLTLEPDLQSLRHEGSHMRVPIKQLYRTPTDHVGLEKPNSNL